MHNFVTQLSLISTVLLCTNAQSVYNRGDAPSYTETPQFSIFNIERSAQNDLPGHREILIFEVPRNNEAPHSRPRLVSLENVVSPAVAQQSPAYVSPSAYPQSPYVAPTTEPAPTWGYQNSAPRQQPYYVAIEDVVPTPPKNPPRHFSLFDVNLPAPPAIFINHYPKGSREVSVEAPLPNPIVDNLAPPIDVRSTHTNHNVNTEIPNRNSQTKVSTDKTSPTTQPSDPYRASRSADDEDPVILFPRPSDANDESNDDTIEILAPLDRSRRNIVSLENVVGPGQIGYPVYRLPQQPVVTQPYRYPQQPIGTQPYRYPQQPVVVQVYPQQYAGRQPYVSDLCPWGSCYRPG